jgi:hypothetical protein
MISLKDISKLPDKCPVDSTQALVSKVFQQETVNTKFGPKSKQGFVLKDASGFEMRAEVWGQADIGTYEGKEIILKQGKPGKGLEFSRQLYTPKGSSEAKEYTKLSVSNAGQFQVVNGPGANARIMEPQAAAMTLDETPAATKMVSVSTPARTPSLVSGQSVGCAINGGHEILKYIFGPDEVQALIASGEYWEKLNEVASAQIRLATKLEHGILFEPKAPAATKTNEPTA